MRCCFDPAYGLFRETEGRRLTPSSTSHLASPEHLQMFKFTGRVVGKMLFENIASAVPLAAAFLARVQRHPLGPHCLQFLDPPLFRSLAAVRAAPAPSVEELGLTFTCSESSPLLAGVTVHELVPGGADLPVTHHNRLRYIRLLADFLLSSRTEQVPPLLCLACPLLMWLASSLTRGRSRWNGSRVGCSRWWSARGWACSRRWNWRG